MKRDIYLAGISNSDLKVVFRYDGVHYSECDWANRVDRINDVGSFKHPACTEMSNTNLIDIWNKSVRAEEPIQLHLIIQKVIRLEIEPGNIFRRMARTTFEHPTDAPSIYELSPNEESYIAQSKAELNSLILKLKDICRVVHPEDANLNVYGTAISEILILACVAIENHFRQILVKNDYSKSELNTSDFFLAKKPMHLSEYQFAYIEYPWLAESAPFLEWDSEKPTQSLEWYARYNRAKHNRIEPKKQPRLTDLFEAIAGLAAVLIAQFGAPRVLRGSRDIQEFLHLSSYPNWSESELYIRKNCPKWKKIEFDFK